MDSQKVAALTNVTKKSFEMFLGLRAFLVMGDILFHLVTKLYNNIEKNILNPILDPYVPDEFLVFRLNSKIKINFGKFLIELSKTLILAYLTYCIFILTEPYFKLFLKGGG